jgi:hypothetical protein
VSPPPSSPPASVKAAKALGDRRAVPNVDWLVRLLGVPRSMVRDVLTESGHLVSFEEEVRRAQRDAGRSFYAQIRAPLELYALTRILRPQHVIETGVSSGVSSMHFLLGLHANREGTLHSIDLPTQQRGATFAADDSPVALPVGRSTGWAIPAGITDGWDLRLGPSQALLPELVRELPTVDLFLHDSLHTPEHLTFELETIRPRLSPGAVVLADNTQWTGRAFEEFAARVGAEVVPRGRSDLVGLRLAGGHPTATSSARATIRRPAARPRSSR